MVPNGWNVQSIESFCKVSSSKRIMQSDYVKEGVPFYRSKEIILKSKGIEPTDIIYIDVDKFAGLKGKFGAPEEGDILISAVGTLGKCYLVKKGEEFYFKDGNLLWLRELRGVEQLYLIQFMQSPYFQNEIQNMTGGSSQKALTIIKLAQMNLPLPPLPEQRKIAKILSTWDKAISTTERLIDNSKQQKNALMQRLLTGKKRLLDDSGKPFEGEWEEVVLKDLCNKVIDNRGKTPPLSEIGLPLVEINSIVNSKYPKLSKVTKFVSPETFKTWFRNGHPERGDILIATVGSAGISALVNLDEGFGSIAQNLIAIRPNSKADSSFLYYLMNTPYYFSLVRAVVMGAVQPSLKVPHLLSFKMKIPSISEQQKIASVLSNADKEIELLEQQLADLKQEKKALMQQLLTGKRRAKLDDKEVA